MSEKAILLIHCPDRKGIVVSVTEFLHKNGANIINLDQHVDIEDAIFFMRVEFELEDFKIPKEKISEYFGTLVGDRLEMKWELYFSDRVPRMALFVSKMSHCLYDILSRYQSKVWNVEIPLIVSNHKDLESVAASFGIDFYHLPITKENKQEQEAIQKNILEKYSIDFVVLARYMQIISEDFIESFRYRIINIHHSFLPAFPGAKPYHSAHKRGVKIIGATSHYVTEELDAGPIIEQDIAHINHKNSINDLVRKGQDLEKVVLSRAIYNHLQHKVLVYNNKTIVFD